MKATLKRLKFSLVSSLVLVSNMSGIAVAQITGQRVQSYDDQLLTKANQSDNTSADASSYGAMSSSLARASASARAADYALLPTEVQLLTQIPSNDPRDPAVPAKGTQLRHRQLHFNVAAQTNASISGDTPSQTLTSEISTVNTNRESGVASIYKSPW